ncbi:hypothetical protein C8R42DRAFT_724780 [Lentinula raphanica]|nr:hypothetical protein C8R42DRAFT_724780 [Lentinula raphanica]
MQPGIPIQGPQDFDLAAVLDQLHMDEQNPQHTPFEDDAQSVLSEISELTESDNGEADSEVEDDPYPRLEGEDASSKSLFSSLHCNLSSMESFNSRFSPPDQSLPQSTEDFTPPEGLSGQKRRRWLKTQRNHQKKRKKEQLSQIRLNSFLRDITKKRVQAVQPIQVAQDVSALPHTKKGWAGLKAKLAAACPELVDLLGDEYNMELVDWNGVDAYNIVDGPGQIIVVLGGKPRDREGEKPHRTWTAMMIDLKTRLADAGKNMTFTSKQMRSMRGGHPSVSMGTSFGGGSQKPGTLKFNGKNNQRILMKITESSAFQRLQGFVSTLFLCYAPRTYEFYQSNLNRLFESNPLLFRWFPKTVFPAVSFNLGPQTVTWPHKDFHNLAWGWCSVTALGDFDPDKGGHLVLWDIGLIIRFPS